MHGRASKDSHIAWIGGWRETASESFCYGTQAVKEEAAAPVEAAPAADAPAAIEAVSAKISRFTLHWML